MKINLESSWDYYRKLNLIILLVISLGINIGFTFFEKFNLNLSLILTSINIVFLIKRNIFVGYYYPIIDIWEKAWDSIFFFQK